MKIVIWTKSPPKVAAIEEAIKKCIYFEWEKSWIMTCFKWSYKRRKYK